MVKSRAAAIHYKNHITELHAVRAHVGDFGHCRNMFVPMMQATSAYIDDETIKYLKRPLQSTGLYPNFYMTFDISTNDRETNQVSMICPIVDGKREAIALHACSVSNNALGNVDQPQILPRKFLPTKRIMQGSLMRGCIISVEK